VEITLIGRPGKVIDRGTCVVMSMKDMGEKIPMLPKGVPTPPRQETTYMVYIGAKRWRGVAAAASDPEDTLIIKEYIQLNSRMGSIAVSV